MPFAIDSPVFHHQEAIPAVYTCEGRDLAPPLTWQNAPSGTKSLVLIVDDPDAPDPKAPKITWVHWLVYNLPADSQGLAEGGALPAGAKSALNDWQREGYGGPCPPIGRHRYFHKLYALDTVLPDLGKANKAALEQAMKGHVLAETQLIGTYEKTGKKQ